MCNDCVTTCCWLFFASFSQGAYKPKHNKKPVDLSQEQIEELSVGMNINNDTFIDKYGKRMVRLETNNKYLVFYKLNSAMEIGVKVDGTLSLIRVTSDPKFKAKTAKGISVGSTRQQVIEAYGKKYYQRNEQGLNVIGYTDPKESRVLEFWILEDHVLVISFEGPKQT